MESQGNNIPLFFRGEPEKYKIPLQPKVFRTAKKKMIYKERRIMLDFKQYLPANNLDYHPIKDRLKMLIDMQHHEIPTRLLDWTLSPLFALYFALKDDRKNRKNGYIYVLDSEKLQSKSITTSSPPVNSHDINIHARALLSDRNLKDSLKSLIIDFYNAECFSERDFKCPFPFVAPPVDSRIKDTEGYRVSGCG